MYRSLQQEFQGDKVAKIKATRLIYQKQCRIKKKKEEETLYLKKKLRSLSRRTVAVVVVEDLSSHWLWKKKRKNLNWLK